MTAENVIFHIEGGLGKHIMATAVMRRIKKVHPDKKLIVVCAYPELFINLPYVYRVYALGKTQYFYDDYVRGGKSIIYRHEPYLSDDHINKRKHIIRTWCDMYGLGYDNETPEIILNSRQSHLGNMLWKREKPIMLIQSNGGLIGDDSPPHSWARDIPRNVTEKIVDRYKGVFHFIQVCKSNINAVKGCEVVDYKLLNYELISLLLASKVRVLNDSCLQHASSAFNIKSTVLWLTTDHRIFGYETNDNIVGDIGNTKLPDSYMFDYSFSGLTHECPIMDPETVFNYSDIYKSIDNQILNG